MKLPKSPSSPLLRAAARHLATASLAISAASQLLAAPSSYTIVDLGTLPGGTQSEAYGINNAGQVVGASEYRATLFSGTGSGNIDLGTFGGSYSRAIAINDAGQIVGDAITTSGQSHAALFSGNGEGNTDLGSVYHTDPANWSASAVAISNDGTIVGSAFNPQTSDSRAIRFNTAGGSNTYLSESGGGAGGISNSGEIVGGLSLGSGFSLAVRFGTTPAENSSLGVIEGYFNSSAGGINDAGQIVGLVANKFFSHAALFSGTGSGNTDLGTLPGHNSSGAFDINNAGQIVGTSAGVAVLWENGQIYNLNDLIEGNPYGSAGITISPVSSGQINDWGQIAATSQVGGPAHALLLNPSSPTTSTNGVSRNTKFVSGTEYAEFTPTTRSGGAATTVDFLEGTAGSESAGAFGLNRDVTVSFADSPAASGLVSDIVSLTGTVDDILVLALSYDEQAYAAGTVSLSWLADGDTVWQLATAGNTGPPGGLAGEYLLTFEDFLSTHGGTFDPESMLGAYGSSAGQAWAVINHNSDFGVLGIPEPSAFLLVAAGLGFLPFRRMRRVR